MFLKHRSEPSELMRFRYLSRRMRLSAKQENYYLNLEKGFLGEKKFDTWLQDASSDWLIVNDLLLENNNTLFQIDTLIISQDKIYILEIKNYEGNYYMDGDRWYSTLGNEIKNPLLQLKRNASLFRRFVHDLGYNYTIDSFVIFVNPDFFLYQAPLNIPIIFPNQINSFLTNSNKKSHAWNQEQLKFAEKLITLHLNNSPYSQLPEYFFHQLTFGITCTGCPAFISAASDKICTCDKCGFHEDVSSAVLRNIVEYRNLFPDRKITTTFIHEWCNIIKSKKTIRKILQKNLVRIGHTKSTHYI